MKFTEWIQEGKLNTKEKIELTKAILNNKSKELKIDRSVVRVMHTPKGLIFTFDKSMTDLAASISDIADSLDLGFKSKLIGDEIQITILD